MLSQEFDPKKFVEFASDGIIAANAEGIIIFWNHSAERIFGYANNEALDQSLDLIIPERFRSRHWEGFHKVMQTGQTRYSTETLRVPGLRKDGQLISIAFTVVILATPDQQSRIIAAIVRDESVRWKEEQAMRKRINELERKR